VRGRICVNMSFYRPTEIALRWRTEKGIFLSRSLKVKEGRAEERQQKTLRDRWTLFRPTHEIGRERFETPSNKSVVRRTDFDRRAELLYFPDAVRYISRSKNYD
jgi:hypothetical protein